MFQRVIEFVKASKPLQFAVVFVAGGAVAAVFYPTKHIEEKLQKTFQEQVSTLNQQHSQELASTVSKYESQLKEVSTTNSQLTEQITSLTTQVTNLKSRQKKTFFKIVHPDGTVEERATSQTDTDMEQQVSQEVQQEYKQQLQTEVTKLEEIQASQVASLQKQWDAKEQSYMSQIATLQQSKTVDTNPKNFTFDVGMLTNLDYYGHVTYNIWGPLVLGAQGQFGPSPAAGLGLGLRF